LVDLAIWLDQGDLRFRPRGSFQIPGAYGFYKQLLSQAVRHKARWVHWASVLTQRPAHELDLEAIGCIILGLVQLSAPEDVEPWAAVDESVELVGWAGKPHLKPVVNACLRRFQRQQELLESELTEEQRLSYSKWMLKRWAENYGPEAAVQIAENSNEEPKVWLVSKPEMGDEALAAQLLEAGFKTEVIDGYLCALQPGGLFKSDLFLKGQFFVQDPSAQKVSKVAAPYATGEFLDSCAAPGGKLANLLWNQNEKITNAVALEPNPTRMIRLQKNIARLGLEPELIQGEAEFLDAQGSFDFILADVPCSATGTIGKHPEIKWNRKPYDFDHNHKMQVNLVGHLCGQLKPGGYLLYSTCSLEPEENQQVVEALLAADLGMTLCPVGEYLDKYLLTLPQPGQSGSFAALLRRNP